MYAVFRVYLAGAPENEECIKQEEICIGGDSCAGNTMVDTAY